MLAAIRQTSSTRLLISITDWSGKRSSGAPYRPLWRSYASSDRQLWRPAQTLLVAAVDEVACLWVCLSARSGCTMVETSFEHRSIEGRVMRFVSARGSVGVAAMVCCSMVGVPSISAAPSGTLTAHVIVTGLPDVPPGSVFSGVGPFSLVFDKQNRLLFTDAVNLGFYAFSGTASNSPVPLSTGNVQTGLTWGKHAELFAARFQEGDIVQVDPTTGGSSASSLRRGRIGA